ncbi:NUDIX hydrolase [Vibrio parahaemolyticus]|uniref:NUDIX hydrolase n=1 Tax=Vibrio parahaemolyticus TaxID=670 RepID=UPI0022B399E7|nr:NUDIX hydrolase [Vibrio parahaemolyticus]MCZ5870691.1 NUDIX hydrolase [Vibrio parahaemolyticus]MCZ5900969.1 NUDIX hydrolase [Vibrio parahaemolyticus]MCZ6023836.1 NUDIX hydrolase [Vibrio parahaemolyticus]MCZ6309253.1 NUDIX hydrolase [Vibrio parahaemolyticus]
MKDLSMAVVVKQGKVLIQNRYRRGKGMVFEFPGGSVDSDESGEQAAIRELWEETGLNGLKVLGNHTAQNCYGGEISYVVLEALPNQEPTAVDPERKQTFYWFIPTDITRGDFFEADLAFIEKHLGLYT